MKSKNRKNTLCIILGLLVILFSFTSCSLHGNENEITPGKAKGEYATQQRLSTIEYSLYVNKQITVFTEQLQTRLVSCTNKEAINKSEIQRAEHSLEIMNKAKDEMEITYPSKGRDEDRTEILDAMNTAIKDTESYINDLKNNQDVSSYTSIFKENINQLTGLASLYYE